MNMAKYYIRAHFLLAKNIYLREKLDKLMCGSVFTQRSTIEKYWSDSLQLQ